MDGQRRLVITLAVGVNVPPTGLDFNGLVSAFERFGDLSTGLLFTETLTALEREIGDRLCAEEPGRYVWNGFQGQAKRWTLPFGQVKHRYHRLWDRKKRRSIAPLRDALSIPLRNRYGWAVLAGPVGLASELSFRRAATEGKRLQNGLGPARSTTWEYFQSLAGSGIEPFAVAPERTLEVLIADGTKLKRQRRGTNEGLMDLRIVLSETRAGRDLQVVAFDLDAEWPALKARLNEAFPGEEVGVLLTDGEEAIEALADARTRVQRCLLHGSRGLRFALYQDGFKKKQQDPLLEKLLRAKAWRMNAEALAELPEKSRYYLSGLIDHAKRVCQDILEALPERATHARAYIAGFVHDGLSFLRALANGEPPIPGVTTNQIENVIGQMDTRLKEIGRRWGLEGGLNMVRVLLTKIFRPELWKAHLAALRNAPSSLTIEVKILSQAWTS